MFDLLLFEFLAAKAHEILETREKSLDFFGTQTLGFSINIFTVALVSLY